MKKSFLFKYDFILEMIFLRNYMILFKLLEFVIVFDFEFVC